MKTILKRSPLPRLAHISEGLGLGIRIRDYNGRFLVEFQHSGRFYERPIDLTPHDLETLNKNLRERVQQMINASNHSWTTLSLGTAMRPLAEAGHWAFQKIFPDDVSRSAITEALETGKRVQIQTESFFISWESLYPPETSLDILPKEFWGMKYEIQRWPIFNQCPNEGRFEPDRITTEGKMKVQLLTDTALPSVVELELPFFFELDKQRRVVLVKLRDLNMRKREKDLSALAAFLRGPAHIAHFACHAKHDDSSPMNSVVRFTKGFQVTLQDLDNANIVLNDHRLVILNACQTGDMNPLYTSHFARRFLLYGARGVVATDCEVPDKFAAQFTTELYTRLLDGKHLGESLLEARQSFMENANDPSGLLYCMYASPFIHFYQKRRTSDAN